MKTTMTISAMVIGFAVSVANAGGFPDQHRCFQTVDTNYTTPQQAMVCVDVSPECTKAMDAYYTFEAKEFGCGIKDINSCPSQAENDASWPPTYCWPSEFIYGPHEGSFLASDKQHYDLLLKAAK